MSESINSPIIDKSNWISLDLTPPLINEPEILDDPLIDLTFRKKILLELDNLNIKRKIYKNFCNRFFKWLNSLNMDEKKISILEFGSGSGGLAREIIKDKRNKWSIDYSMMDIDLDILKWSQESLRTQNIQCSIFPSKDQHLAQFREKQFHVVISLHVIHHIHPIDQVQLVFKDISKIAKYGFFMLDFERRIGNELLSKVANAITGLSPELNADGVRSVKRCYTANEVKKAMTPNMENFSLKVSKLYPAPYFEISGIRYDHESNDSI